MSELERTMGGRNVGPLGRFPGGNDTAGLVTSPSRPPNLPHDQVHNSVTTRCAWPAIATCVFRPAESTMGCNGANHEALSCV